MIRLQPFDCEKDLFQMPLSSACWNTLMYCKSRKLFWLLVARDWSLPARMAIFFRLVLIGVQLVIDARAQLAVPTDSDDFVERVAHFLHV
jgi:hypothetical protein